MAEQMEIYVTMTSEDILERIDPDYFHVALAGRDKGCSSDDIEYLRESALANFKKDLLEDEECPKVARFIQECYHTLDMQNGTDDDDEDELASDTASSGNSEADNSDDEDASDEQDADEMPFAIHEELEDNPKDELTAESTIPSYYLKSIFIKEVESMIASGEKFTDACLITIPWRVYNRLLEACSQGNLSTLFLPEQNMFQRAMKSRDTREAEKMRTIYCRNIIRVMESLGFKEQGV